PPLSAAHLLAAVTNSSHADIDCMPSTATSPPSTYWSTRSRYLRTAGHLSASSSMCGAMRTREPSSALGLPDSMKSLSYWLVSSSARPFQPWSFSFSSSLAMSGDSPVQLSEVAPESMTDRASGVQSVVPIGG